MNALYKHSLCCFIFMTMREKPTVYNFGEKKSNILSPIRILQFLKNEKWLVDWCVPGNSVGVWSSVILSLSLIPSLLS